MKRALAVALVAAAALLGACGGSSSGNSSDDTTDTTLDCSAAAIMHAPDFNTYDAACADQSAHRHN